MTLQPFANVRWHELILLLCALTLPWPIGFNNLSIALLVMWWLSKGNMGSKWALFVKSKWAWAFAFFYITIVALSLWSAGPEETASEALQKITLLLFPLILATSDPLSPREIGLIKRGFVYSCFTILVISLVVALIHFNANDAIHNFDTETGASFDRLHPKVTTAWMHLSYIQVLKWIDLHPTYFSLYLAFCLVILINEQLNRKSINFIHQLMAVIISIFIIFLASRIAILVVGLCLIAAIFKNTYEKKKESAIQALGLVLTLALVLWINPVSKFRLIEEPANTEYRLNQENTSWNSVNYRLLEWRASLNVIWKSPLLGIGPNEAQKAMNSFYQQFNQSTVNLNYNAHNQYLQTWMELGVIGLIGLLACIFVPLMYRDTTSTHVAFILIFSVMCLTESLLERQKGIVFFAFFQSVMMCSQKKGK
ncbi:MAG: O-antigen ligase family protein [Bacteroidetes bacterium]|nr:O-antigen ligase family protein [Bacteroidota bacterium]